MRVIIAGSRNGFITDSDLDHILKTHSVKVTEVVCGGCRGIDRCGEHYASIRGLPIKYFDADWENYGRAAGPIRNQEMAKYGDVLLAVLYPNSKGTANMIECMQKQDKPIIVIKREE